MTEGYRAALEQARLGQREGGGIPIGAALARREEVLGAGRNRRIQSGDPTAHAEIDCLRDAGRLRTYSDLTLYTTLTPCFLCMGAVVLFQLGEVVIGDETTFDGQGSMALLRDRGVSVTLLDDEEARSLLRQFIADHPDVWGRGHRRELAH